VSLLRKFVVAYLFQALLVLLFIGTAMWGLWLLHSNAAWWLAPIVAIAWIGFVMLFIRNDRFEKMQDQVDKEND
jgi:membrane protein YdbS with pleckstrin-like domain